MATVEVFYANFTIHITDLQVGPIPEPFASKMRESNTILQRKMAEYEFKNQILKDHTLLKVFRENMQVEVFQRTIGKQSPENEKRKRKYRRKWETEDLEETKRLRRERKRETKRRSKVKTGIQHVESDDEQDENDEQSEKNTEDDSSTSDNENEEEVCNNYTEENIELGESDVSISCSGKRKDEKRQETRNQTEKHNSLNPKETALFRADALRLATENQVIKDIAFGEENVKESNTNVQSAIENSIVEGTNVVQEDINRAARFNDDEDEDAGDSDKGKRKSGSRSTVHEETWVQHYMDLLEYKEKFGNCNVPTGYPFVKGLALWVMAQRNNGKRFLKGKYANGMNDERYEMLDKIGFNWSGHPTWEEFYEMLKEYKATYGHCHVPREWKPNNKLSIWAMQMRQHGRLFRKGQKTAYMTAERHSLLDKIGFCWDKQMAEFIECFEKLKQYKEKYGHCNVPTRFEDSRLANFVQHLRKQYKAYEAGKRVDSMTPERIAMLENIGFVWKVGTNYVHLKNFDDK